MVWCGKMLQYWNMDDAEEARAAKNARSLDEDQLGLLEIDVRSLGQLLRKGDNKVQTERKLSYSCCYSPIFDYRVPLC